MSISAHAPGFQPEQAAEFLEPIGDVPDPDGAVMRGAVAVPVIDELPRLVTAGDRGPQAHRAHSGR